MLRLGKNTVFCGNIHEKMLLTGISGVGVTKAVAAETTIKASMSIPSGAKQYQGHMYYVYDQSSMITWAEAQNRCEAKGGHLVTITSAGEQDFVASYFKSKSQHYGFIGGLYKNGKAQWVTGEKMSYLAPNSIKPSSTVNPYSIMSWSTGHWDTTGQQSYAYICEWDTSTATVLPDKVEGVKVTKVDKQSVTVSWKKVSGAKGYAVYMKTGKSGSYKKVKDITDKSVTSIYKNKLEKGKTYYFRVRAFKTIYGERSYGDLSDEKKITLK